MNQCQPIVDSTPLTQTYHLRKWNSSELKNVLLKWWFGLLSLWEWYFWTVLHKATSINHCRNVSRALYQRSSDAVYQPLSWSQQGLVLARSGVEPLRLKRDRFGTEGEKSAELPTSTSCGDFVADTGREGLRRRVRGQNNWREEYKKALKCEENNLIYATIFADLRLSNNNKQKKFHFINK